MTSNPRVRRSTGSLATTRTLATCFRSAPAQPAYHQHREARARRKGASAGGRILVPNGCHQTPNGWARPWTAAAGRRSGPCHAAARLLGRSPHRRNRLAPAHPCQWTAGARRAGRIVLLGRWLGLPPGPGRACWLLISDLPGIHPQPAYPWFRTGEVGAVPVEVLDTIGHIRSLPAEANRITDRRRSGAGGRRRRGGPAPTHIHCCKFIKTHCSAVAARQFRKATGSRYPGRFHSASAKCHRP
jgi:hypothetical protein